MKLCVSALTEPVYGTTNAVPTVFFPMLRRCCVSNGIALRRFSTAIALVWLTLSPVFANAVDVVDANNAATNTTAHDSYHFGDGVRLDNSNWMLGGYSSATFNNPSGHAARADLDHLSLFLWWDGEQRWKFFSEFDYENVVASRPAEREDEDRYLALERLYVDYAATDASTIRIGKFLTPIGRWNEIHAPPLVWTTSRPLLTSITFPTNVTGAMLSGHLPGIAKAVEYSIYGSNGHEIRANPDQDPFYAVVGAHLKMPIARDVHLGLSYANFEQRKTREERKQLVGLDFAWNIDRYEFSAEGTYRYSDNGSDWDERGAFIQLAIPLSQRLYAVGRVESFRKAQERSATQLWVTGLNFRLTPAVVLKVEWIGGEHNSIGAPEGFMSSASVLF
jgi:hypothetical protein